MTLFLCLKRKFQTVRMMVEGITPKKVSFLTYRHEEK